MSLKFVFLLAISADPDEISTQSDPIRVICNGDTKVLYRLNIFQSLIV